jgi:hypothetical protein
MARGSSSTQLVAVGHEAVDGGAPPPRFAVGVTVERGRCLHVDHVDRRIKHGKHTRIPKAEITGSVSP